MDIFTHLLVGFFFSFLFLQPYNSILLVFYAIFMAALPDLDIFLEPLYKRFKSEAFLHKGGSHSLVSAFFVSSLTGLLFSWVFNVSFLIYWLIGFLFTSLHAILDSLASSRVPLLYPIIEKKFRLFIERAVNPFLAFISGIIMLMLFFVFFIDFISFRVLVNLFFSFYLFYFSFRITVKLWFKIKYPNKLYIPGIFPFAYMIYEKNESDGILSFKLTKKYLFKKKEIVLINSEVIKESEKMILFSKALSLTTDYAFFSKWDGIIPIWMDQENIELFLLLAESFTNYTSYFLKVTFDRTSKEIIGRYHGFDNILEYLKIKIPIKDYINTKM